MYTFRLRPLQKPVIIVIIASLVSGILLFFLSFAAPAGGKSPVVRLSGTKVPYGYAVLTVDASWPDLSIRELLAGEGIFNTIGESSQWVFLDDFGELEKVPLDSYSERVEPFDPRNDGYAERLRSFFVNQGSRRIFIPLKGTVSLEGRVRAALGDIPFSLSVLTPPEGTRSVVLPGILFIPAAAFTLFLSGEALLTAFFLPLWAVLAGQGVPGFAVLAILAGLFRFLREPVRDYFMVRRYGKSSWQPLWGALPQGILFLVALGGIMIFGAVRPLTVILGFLFFLALLGVSLWAESHREARRGHIRFRQVPITGIHRGFALRPSPCVRIMAPFTLAALVLLLAPGARIPHASSRDWTGWKSPLPLNAEAYSAHVAFQRAFSLMPLGTPFPLETDPAQDYLRYSLAEDGLIDGAAPGESVDSDESVDSFEIPPFPLEGLIDFFTNYSYTDPGTETNGLLCLLIVLGLGGSLIFRDRRRPLKLAMYMDKRIAA
jgi:hypothetical protein